jgi:putative membrane protein
MIKRLLLHILATAIILYSISQFLHGDFAITGSYKGYLIAAILFGFLNSIVKPLLKILSLPLVFLSAGLFLFVLNAILVWFAKYALDVLQFEGVAIIVTGGLLTYLIVGFALSVGNTIIHWLTEK